MPVWPGRRKEIQLRKHSGPEPWSRGVRPPSHQSMLLSHTVCHQADRSDDAAAFMSKISRRPHPGCYATRTWQTQELERGCSSAGRGLIDGNKAGGAEVEHAPQKRSPTDSHLSGDIISRATSGRVTQWVLVSSDNPGGRTSSRQGRQSPTKLAKIDFLEVCTFISTYFHGSRADPRRLWLSSCAIPIRSACVSLLPLTAGELRTPNAGNSEGLYVMEWIRRAGDGCAG